MIHGLTIAFAPLQGYTDAAYRRAHHAAVGAVDEYYTPFVRLEHGEPRRRDLRDISPEACHGVPTVPQVIAADADEFARLCDAVEALGWRRLDLNMGCPFPMQTRAGRGSGLLQHPDRLEAIGREMQRRPEVTFSIKMRTGQSSVEEGLESMSIMNDLPLHHVTIHPRLGVQQYKGTADREAFVRLAATAKHPVVYNGDITTLEQLDELPCVHGVMLGRGLLARPWILSDRDPQQVVRQMHAEVYRHAEEHLCGDSQILSRLHAFWEYLAIDPRRRKAILKATSLPRYREAVAQALASLQQTPLSQ